jgi:Ca2+-binding RTX toxin-like protein
MFTDRTFDIAFNVEDGNFYAVVSPTTNGGDGQVIKIDMSTVPQGGTPTFTSIPITGTLYGETMEAGLTKGSYGAVFMDGEGNLYYGLNRGDHDLDASTGVQGAIFQVEADWESGQAYSVYMSEAPSTGSNDGAVDPRSTNPFSEVDASAEVLIREPTLTQQDGGNDVLRGGIGDDELHRNAGNDRLHGGGDNDILFGDEGSDILHGGTGDDWAAGGTGNDKLFGNAGSDELFGNDGRDNLNGGVGDDQLSGGAGEDKLVGGTGSDMLEGGEGNDHLWGGNWNADQSADTFVFTNGTDKDYIHDFEVDTDLIDLSDYDTNFADVQASMVDLGWATVLELRELDGAASGDRVVIKNVDASDLTADSFIF